MKIHIVYGEDESPDSITNLSVASAIYDSFKPLRPDIDLSIVGHLIESQAIHDSRVKDYGHGMCVKENKHD